MLSFIREQTHHYLIMFELKSDIKTEECKNKNLKSDLEKLQRKAYEIGSSLDTLKWRIKSAEFVLSCEKKHHNFFYNVIKTNKDKVATDDLFHQNNRYGSNLINYRVELEKKKTQLIMQLEELKKQISAF